MAENIVQTSLFFNDNFELDNAFEDEEIQSDGKYTAKVTIPQYKPSNYCPAISEMMYTLKYEDLVEKINKSSVPDDIKRFLRLAATRHIVFNYSKVADYYAHADKELQELLEDSAMVVVDVNNALANGFAKLDYRLLEIAERAKEANAEEVSE